MICKVIELIFSFCHMARYFLVFLSLSHAPSTHWSRLRRNFFADAFLKLENSADCVVYRWILLCMQLAKACFVNICFAAE